MALRWCILGGAGLLGRAFGRRLPEATRLTHAACDITRPAEVTAALERERPDVVVLCAAMTAVDACEGDQPRAQALNAVAPGDVARAADRLGARLVHLSTDYVFDGRSRAAWREDDATGPLSVYGATKLEGERAVRGVLGDDALIVRAQWLYGQGGPDFVDAILSAARQRSVLRVVEDQRGAPTQVDALADAIVRLVGCDARGTVHFAASGACNRAEWARAILSAAGLNVQVEPCTTAEFPRPAARPANSVFDLSRYIALTGDTPADWSAEVMEFVARSARAPTQ